MSRAKTHKRVFGLFEREASECEVRFPFEMHVHNPRKDSICSSTH